MTHRSADRLRPVADRVRRIQRSPIGGTLVYLDTDELTPVTGLLQFTEPLHEVCLFFGSLYLRDAPA